MIKGIIRKARQNGIVKYIFCLLDPTSIRVEKFAASLSGVLSEGARILDAGAGETPYKNYFLHQHYFAVDIQWGDPDWNYSKLDAICNLTALPILNKHLDAVLCTQVLEHVNEPFLIISEFYRILKPGGLLYVSAPQGWGVHQAPHDYFRFTQYGLKYLLEKAGFQICSITPTCGYFGYLANRLTVFPKTLFWQIKNRALRIVMFPFEVLAYLVFVLIFPIFLNWMDGLDAKRDYTLNYMVKAVKNE